MSDAATPRPDVHELASATPASRNRYIDLLRVVSIGVVVLGHWLMAVLGYEDGAFTGSNLLELDADLQILTWVFQVMPLFFIVGGFTNARSWRSASRRGTRYADWLRARGARLVRPALWFVAFWTLIPVVGVTLGILPASVARIGGQEVALPLWFLAVYVVAVAAVPPLLAVHERYGVRTLVGLAAAALVVDVLYFGADVPVVGAANYLFVWLAVMELGFLWCDGALGRPRWLPGAMAAGGLVTLAVLVTWFDYPVSMVGLTHASRQNVQPPSIALLALAVWQCGATLACERPANRWLARPRVWIAVVVANSMVMTFYLWNMSAVVLAAVLLFPTGVAPQPDPLGTEWWLLRPVWIVVCASCLVPFLLGFRWAERPGAPPPPAGLGLAGVAPVVGGIAIASVGIGLLAANAFPVPGEVVVFPTIGVACLVVGAVFLRVNPVPR